MPTIPLDDDDIRNPNRRPGDSALSDDDRDWAERERARSAQQAEESAARQERMAAFSPPKLGSRPVVPVMGEDIGGGLYERRTAPDEDDPIRNAAPFSPSVWRDEYANPAAPEGGGDFGMGSGGPFVPAGEGKRLSEADVIDIRKRYEERKAAQMSAADRSRLMEGVNPEQSAKALELAERTGRTRLEVQQDIPGFTAIDMADRLDRLRASAPKLRSWLDQTPDNFDLAHDDTENLEWWESAGSMLYNTPGALYAGGVGVGESIFSLGQMAFDAADEMVRSPSPALAALMGDPKEANRIALERQRLQTGAIDPRNPDALLAGTADALGGVRSGLRDYKLGVMPQGRNDIESGYYSGMVSLATQAPLIAAAAITKNPSIATVGMTASTAGEAYSRVTDEYPDMTFAERAGYALRQAGIEFVTELGPNVIIVDALTKGAVKDAIIGGVKSRVAEQLGEQAATALQDLDDWLTLNPEGTWQDYVDARGSAAMQTFVATLVATEGQMAAGKAGVALANRMDSAAQQKRTEDIARMIVAMAQGAASSKLLKRMPEKYREAVAAITKDGPLETIRVDGEAFGELAQEKGVTVEKLAQAFRIDAAEALTAIEAGHDVVIPAGNYAAMIQTAKKELGFSGETVHQALAPNIRLRADDFTAKEVEAMKKIAADEQAAREKEAREAEQPLTLQTLPQQLLMRARETSTGFVRAETLAQEEREMLAEAGYKPNAEGEYDLGALITEADARKAKGTLNSSMSQWDNSHITDWQAKKSGRTSGVAFADAADRVREDSRKRLAEAGRFNAETTAIQSAVPAELIVTLAERTGQDPEVLWKEYAAKVENSLKTEEGELAQGEARASTMTQRVTQMVKEGRSSREIHEALGRSPEQRNATNAMVSKVKKQLRENPELAQSQSSLPMDEGSRMQRAREWGGGADIVSRDQAPKYNFQTGKPVTVEALHGTRGRDIERFDLDEAGSNFSQDEGTLHFSDSADDANAYATSDTVGLPADDGVVYPVYIRMRNPLVADGAFFKREGMGDIYKTEDRISVWDSYHPFLKERAEEIGADGIILKDSFGRSHYVSFDPKNIRSKFAAFDPSQEGSSKLLAQEQRGGFTGTNLSQEAVIRLYESANLSTFVHETAHWYLTTLEKMARLENPHPFVIEQLAAIRNWAGKHPEFEIYDANGQITEQGVEVQEAFAETFEAYLRDGKAPSTAMRSVFAAFKFWLLRVYKSIVEAGRTRYYEQDSAGNYTVPAMLRANLNAEITSVFDRALATDEALAAVRKGMDQNAEQMAKAMLDKGVITQKQYERTKARILEAKEKAEADLMARLMEQYERNQKTWWREEERETRRDVASEIDEQPAMRAYSWLAGEGWRDTLEDHVERAAQEQMELAQALRAFHGSKHRFDRFEISTRTIGSGEGTQSRGYGLYFADRESLANFYKNIDRVTGPEDFAGVVLAREGGDIARARAFFKGEIKRLQKASWGSGLDKSYKDALAALNAGKATDMAAKQTFLYEVDLNVSPETEMLDMDASIASQSEAVQKRVAAAWSSLMGDAAFDPARTGYELFEIMGNRQPTSDALLAAGIKGVRFLDALSRARQDGSRNYVMFSADDIKIVARNGEAVGEATEPPGLLPAELIGSAQGELAQSRQLDAMGFYSAAQEAATRVPDNIWKMGWQAARNSIAKGQDGIVPRKSELEWLGIDAMFGDTKLRGEELKTAVLEHIAAKRLELVENFARFDPNAKAPTKAAMLDELYANDEGMLAALLGLGARREGNYTVVDGYENLTGALDFTLRLAGKTDYGTPIFELVRPLERGEVEVLGAGVWGDLQGIAARIIFDEKKARILRNISKDDVETAWREYHNSNANIDAQMVRGPGDIRLPGEDVPLFEMVIGLPEGVPGSDYWAPRSHVGGKAQGTLVTAHGEERVDDKGQRTLFTGQVQSDMAQQAREDKKDWNEHLRTKALLEAHPDEDVFGIDEDGNYRLRKEGETAIDLILRRTLEDRLAQQSPAMGAPLLSTSEWTNVAVRAMVYRAARDGFASVSFPTAETSEIIQGNDLAAGHYETNVKGALEKVAKQLGGAVRTGAVSYSEEAFMEAVDLAAPYETFMKDKQAAAYILDITPEMREKIVLGGFPLFQTKVGKGRTSPPPNISPMRLDLRAVEEQYGPEALAALPPKVRAYSAQATDADQFVELARDVQATLKKKPPRSLWKFLSLKRTIGEGNDKISYSGIRDPDGEILAMIGKRNEARGLIATEKDGAKSRSYSYEEAAHAAWEEGYFNGESPPGIAEFLDALRADFDGTARLYRSMDQAVVQQIDNANEWANWFDQNEIDINEENDAVLRAVIETKLSSQTENAIGPDEAAPFFKMADGRALLEGIKAGPMRDKLIREETRRRMIAKHGDIFNDGTIAQEAAAYAQNEVQQRQYEIELEALSNASGRQAAANLARETARETLRDKQVREVLNYNQWLILSERWGKKALEAAEKGDFAKAADFKRYQLINTAMFREARKLAETVEKARKHLLAYGDKSKQTRLLAAGKEYQDQLNGLLDDYQFRPESRKAENKRQARGEWIRAQMASIDPYSAYQDATKTDAEKQVEAAEALERSQMLAGLAEGTEAKNFKSITVDELLSVRDEADMIYRLATLKDRLIKEGERRRLSLAAGDIAAEIEANQPNEKPPEPIETDSPGYKAKRSVLKYFAMHRTLQSWARQFAGDKDNGVFWRYIVRPLNEAFARLSSIRKEMGTEVDKLFSVYTKDEQRRMFRDRQTFDFRQSGGPRLTLSKQGRLAFALNWGNAKNRQRLMDSLGLEVSHVQQVLNTLDKRDWDFVQASWDYLDTWFPEANRVHESVHGAPMDKEAPLEIATRFGIYRGGYYPIKFDPMLSSKTGQRKMEADAKTFTGQVGARSQPGFTKSRVKGKVTLPLRLSVLDVITSHLDQVAVSIATEEALFDAGRLIKQPAVENAIISRHGREAYNTIVNTLVTAKFGLEGASGILAHLRNGATVVGLGWKVSTALLQPLGISNSIVRVGGFWIAKGYARMGKDAATIQSSANWIMERSEFMRNRRQSNSPEMQALRGKLKAGVTDIRIPGVALTKAGIDAVKNSAFAMMANVQFYSVDMPTWYGAYFKAQAAGMNEADAVAEADQAVIDSQGGGELHQTSAMQTGAGTRYAAALRLLTNFMSYMITTYNLSVQRIRTARTVGQIAALGFDLSIMLALPVAGKMMLDAWTKGDGEEDDDELFEKYMREQAAFLLSPFVGISQVAGSTRGDDSYGYRGPAGLGIFAEASRAGAAAAEGKFFTEEGEFDAAFWRPANKTAGMIFHYPASQIDASVRGALAYFNGETENPAAFLVGPPPAN